jgi:release factor glutamine methyltransferase
MRLRYGVFDRVVSTLRAAGCVFAEDEARILLESAPTSAALDAWVAERVGGTPLEYIVGWAAFDTLRVAVTPGVFVPRRRTEHLVASARAVLSPHATVLDLGCGSGAVGAALLTAHPLDLYAVDIDPVAVDCARRNVSGRVLLGDLYAPLPVALRGRVHVIVANAPYVPTDAIALMPPEARDHEHRVALDGGCDGLDIVRRVVAGAPTWLAPGGYLFIEASEEQAPVVAAFYRDHRLAARVSTSEDLDGTVVIGHLT